MWAGTASLYARRAQRGPNENALMIMAVMAIPMAQAATHHQGAPQARAFQPQIACTEAGCLPVPRGCLPTGGKTLGGSPTGFDVVVCPDGTR